MAKKEVPAVVMEIMGKGKPGPMMPPPMGDEMMEDIGGPDEAEIAAEEFLAAVDARDPKLVVEALRALMEILD